MNTAVVVSLIGLIVVVTIQVVFIARWTGRIDGYILANDNRFAAYIATNDKRFETTEDEIRRLRDARHQIDGTIQRHDGLLRELSRIGFGRRASDTDSEGP